MTNDLTKLREASARAMGKTGIHTAHGATWIDAPIYDAENVVLKWQPDKDPAQLVECIEFLKDRNNRIEVFNALWNENWREAIMRAVAEISCRYEPVPEE